jgi:hypothetical protein
MTRDGGSRDDAGEEIAASSIGEPASVRLDAFLNELRSLAGGAPPVPSPELEAMLDGAADPVIPQRRRRRHGKTIAGAVIMGSIGAGLSGAAAAQERPPGPAHHAHARVVPEAAPAQDDPLGGPSRKPARSVPEPPRHQPAPGRAVPRIMPAQPITPTKPSHPTKPQQSTPQPTHASGPEPSEDREPGSGDAEHGQDSGHDAPAHEHVIEPGESTPPGSDSPSEHTGT